MKGTMGIYVHGIIEFILSFQIALVFNFINNTK
jgi:hypothetical protein